jgi:hypothetical protein
MRCGKLDADCEGDWERVCDWVRDCERERVWVCVCDALWVCDCVWDGVGRWLGEAVPEVDCDGVSVVDWLALDVCEDDTLCDPEFV